MNKKETEIDFYHIHHELNQGTPFKGLIYVSEFEKIHPTNTNYIKHIEQFAKNVVDNEIKTVLWIDPGKQVIRNTYEATKFLPLKNLFIKQSLWHKREGEDNLSFDEVYKEKRTELDIELFDGIVLNKSVFYKSPEVVLGFAKTLSKFDNIKIVIIEGNDENTGSWYSVKSVLEDIKFTESLTFVNAVEGTKDEDEILYKTKAVYSRVSL